MSSDRSGLSSLKRAIAAYFASISTDADVHIGLAARNLWMRPRVVLIPGRFGGSNSPSVMAGGTFGGPAQKASINPRELAKWERTITFSIFARDPSRPTDEEAQNAALENLVEQTIQACWRGVDPATITPQSPNGLVSGAAGLQFGESIVMAPPVEFAAGRELLLAATQLTPLFDAEQGVFFPTFTLTKGPLDATTTSGTAASITSVASGLVGVTGFLQASPAWVGQFLSLANCASPANNGIWPIVGYTSPYAIVIQNAFGVSPDANNGALVWRIDPLGA